MDWICFIKALLLARVLASGLTVSSYRPIPNCVVVSFRGAACGEHRPSVPPKVGGISFPSSPLHHHHFSPTSFCIHTHRRQDQYRPDGSSHLWSKYHMFFVFPSGYFFWNYR